MVTDEQFRVLLKFFRQTGNKETAAFKAGMDPKTGKRYLKMGKLPSELKKQHDWATRKSPFEGHEADIERIFTVNPGIKSSTIMNYLMKKNPGKFTENQVRTLQRMKKKWLALHGPEKEIVFEQIHKPGVLSASDYTDMSKLEITINREFFKHKIFHFILPYSNWETGNICFSESFESLSEGIQKALWKLGGVTPKHRTDNLTAAVKCSGNSREFQKKYVALLEHYGMKGEKINPNSPNENGDSEQSHFRFKDAVDQALMLRGSRNFESREKYESFIETIFTELNSNRKKRFQEELEHLKPLPQKKQDSYDVIYVAVRRGSTINVKTKSYSVPSRLIGEKVRVHLYHDKIRVFYGQQLVEEFERIIGSREARIDYRHVITYLLRKPGAFENYRYREELYPSVLFRKVYDSLSADDFNGTKAYLRILDLASRYGQESVEKVLSEETNYTLKLPEIVKSKLDTSLVSKTAEDVKVETPKLTDYDSFLQITEVIS